MLDAIRFSIERGDFARAGALWEEWSRELAGRVATGRADDEEWAKTTELFRWSKDVLLCARTQYVDQLNTLHAAGAYGAQQLLGTTADFREQPLQVQRAAPTPHESSATDAPR